jgi:hypothetical protein
MQHIKTYRIQLSSVRVKLLDINVHQNRRKKSENYLSKFPSRKAVKEYQIKTKNVYKGNNKDRRENSKN